jgi:hypothetical protein
VLFEQAATKLMGGACQVSTQKSKIHWHLLMTMSQNQGIQMADLKAEHSKEKQNNGFGSAR